MIHRYHPSRDSPPAGPRTEWPNLGRLLRAELLKISTTSTWRLFALTATASTAAAFAVNVVQLHDALTPADGPPASQTELLGLTANLYTSGQYLGLLLLLLLGMLTVTDEFQHHTITATLLAVPRRELVIAANFTTAAAIGAGAWLITSAETTCATLRT
jgi:ABC-2 type transport system permease protein